MYPNRNRPVFTNCARAVKQELTDSPTAPNPDYSQIQVGDQQAAKDPTVHTFMLPPLQQGNNQQTPLWEQRQCRGCI